MLFQETYDNRYKIMAAYNITSKASLSYGSGNWIINKRDSQKVEAAQMRLLKKSLLGLTRLDC
jgi:hypothetical protein